MTFSIVIPTLDEAECIGETLQGIAALGFHGIEILAADGGSTDGTPDAVENLARSFRIPVRVLRCNARRDLSQSVLTGFDHAHGEILCCMDADGQHRPCDLARLLQFMEKNPDVPLCIGSRFIPGGGFEEKWSVFRMLCSRSAALAARAVLGVRLHDPMSGFFCVRRTLFRTLRPALNPTGFKILLEMSFLARIAGAARVEEIPITFAMRKHGKSKLSFSVAARYVAMVIRLRLHTKKIRRVLSEKSDAAGESAPNRRTTA